MSCSSPLSDYTCQKSSDCDRAIVTGRCEPTGYCSFSDDECGSGFRLGSASGESSGRCTDQLQDAGGVAFDAAQTDADTTISEMTIVKLSAGLNHTCILQQNGTSMCWGDNSSGQLNGLASASDDGSALEYRAKTGDAVGIAAGGRSSCLFGSFGIECIGANDDSQLAGGLILGIDAKTVSIGKDRGASVCALGTELASAASPDAVFCWGGNGIGQATGDGVATGDIDTPRRIIDAGIRQLAVGRLHACALASKQQVVCWGSNEFAQMGLPVDAEAHALESISFEGEGGVSKLAAGHEHNCIIDLNGRVSCWGANRYNQVGSQEDITVPTPTPLGLGIGISVLDISLGRRHSCLLGEDRQVYCWGDNAYGQLGRQAAPGIPVPVLGLSDVDSISVGQYHSCAHVSGVGVYCWGRNDVNQVNTSASQTVAEPFLSFAQP